MCTVFTTGYRHCRLVRPETVNNTRKHCIFLNLNTFLPLQGSPLDGGTKFYALKVRRAPRERSSDRERGVAEKNVIHPIRKTFSKNELNYKPNNALPE